MPTPGDLTLIIGTTMRLTRLITTDDIGQWWIKDPIDALFHPRNQIHGYGVNLTDPTENGPVTTEYPPRVDMRWHKYVSGLSCPFCVGFWVGAGVLATYHLAPRGLWRFIAGALTLNEVAAHLGVKIGDFG